MQSEEMRRAVNAYVQQFSDFAPGGLDTTMPFEVLSADPDENVCLMRFALPQEWMHNPQRTLHGGMIAYALDHAMALHCVYCAGGLLVPTVSLQISYLRPCPMDKPLMVRTTVTKAGRTLSYCSCVAWVEGEESRLVASASGVYNLPSAEGWAERFTMPGLPERA